VSTLERMRELVAAEGGPLAAGLRDAAPAGAEARIGPIAAAGPRASADPDEYALLIETIYEGFLLHYGSSRLLADVDADLALLAGDRLYALGLERLVALGDVEGVRELADVIAVCALLVGRGDDDACEALWRAGARAVGWGAGEGYELAKALARAGDAGAADALRALDAPPARA